MSDESETAEVINTDELETLDEIHEAAAHNRAVMGPDASDGTVVTPGTEPEPEPGPEPEIDEALDNATGGAMSAAAESADEAAEADEEEDEGEEDDEAFDPSEHTVAEVEQFIADNPDLEEDVLAAERAGKNRSSLVG